LARVEATLTPPSESALMYRYQPSSGPVSATYAMRSAAVALGGSKLSTSAAIARPAEPATSFAKFTKKASARSVALLSRTAETPPRAAEASAGGSAGSTTTRGARARGSDKTSPSRASARTVSASALGLIGCNTGACYMSVVSVRVPKELKERMDAFRGVVNWSEEIRAFIERRVAELEQEKAIEELERLVEKLPPAPKGSALRYVREDRDRG